MHFCKLKSTVLKAIYYYELFPLSSSCYKRDKLAIMLINNNYIVRRIGKDYMKKSLSRINRFYIWALKLRTTHATT